MKIESILPTMAAYMGYFNSYIRKVHRQGEIAPEVQEVIFQEKLKEEEKRIQPIYDLRGKLIKYENSGRQLNIMA